MMKRRIFWSLLFLLTLLGGYYAYDFYNRVYAPNVVVDNGKTFVYIPTGSSLEDVAAILDQGHIIVNTEDFLWLARKKNYQDDNVVPGKYEIKNGWSNNDLIRHLRAGRGRLMVKVTIGSVRSLDQIAEAAGKELELDGDQLLKDLKDPRVLDKFGFNSYTILTLFIPNTYEFTWNTSKEEFIDRMAKEYKTFWTDDRKAKAQKLGLKQSEVAILASIVQSEQQRRKDEWPDIAGLYVNRLKKGMRLQSDPTVVFALGDFSINRVYVRHIEEAAASPYNTYTHGGLPPGPIRLPEIKAIDAVLDHKQHNYIFMCAKPGYEGYHNFAVNESQHSANARAYHKWLNKEGIR